MKSKARANPAYMELCRVCWRLESWCNNKPIHLVTSEDCLQEADCLAARADMAEELGDMEEVNWCRVLERDARERAKRITLQS